MPSLQIAGTEYINLHNHCQAVLEKTVWVGLCIVGGILLGKIAPNLAKVPVMLMLVGFCKKTTHWFEK